MKQSFLLSTLCLVFSFLFLHNVPAQQKSQKTIRPVQDSVDYCWNAKEIDMINDGLAEVKVEILEWGEG